MRILMVFALLSGLTACSGTNNQSVVTPVKGAGLHLAVAPISGASPYRNSPCGTATMVDSEHDGFLAVSPSNPENLIAVWDQDDNSGTVAAYSIDGGQTWSAAPLPSLTSCRSLAPYDYAFDPWISIGGDGTAYAIAALEDADAPSPSHPENFAVAVNVSRDGGRNWNASVVVARQTTPLVVDKTTIRADPYVSGRAYATWTNLLLGPGTSTNVVSRTEDHGGTWSAPETIFSPPPDRAVFDSEIHVLPNGDLLSVFIELPAQPLLAATGEFREGPYFIKTVRSNDQGRTWTSPVTLVELQSRGLNDPDGGEPLDAIPFQDISTTIATDGTTLVSWVDRSADPKATLLLSISIDGGQSWTSPRKVADFETPVFVAAIAAHPGGHWAAMYYDLRDDVPGRPGTEVSAWLRETRDRGASWSEIRLGGPFDARRLQDHVTSSPEWGDYFGLVSLPGGFGATFNLGAPAAQVGSTDVFFSRIASGSGNGR